MEVAAVYLVSLFVLRFLSLTSGHDCIETTTTTTTTRSCDSLTTSSTAGSTASCVGQKGNPGKHGPPGQKGEAGDGCDEEVGQLEIKLNKLKVELHNKIRALNGECFAGMKSGNIEDDQIDASSWWSQPHRGGHHPMNARLDAATHAWEPNTTKSAPHWIGVDFRTPRVVQGLILQGRHLSHNHWTTSFKVQYGDDAARLRFITEGKGDKVFVGSNDRDTHAVRIFPEEITARFVRIVPVTWHAIPAIRFEILSCS